MLTHPIVKLRRDQVLKLFYEESEGFRIFAQVLRLCA